MNYRGRRATIMGLGHFGGGVAAARWLARQGALVTVSDAADEHALADSLPPLADAPIAAIHLGGHRAEDFQRADIVVVNPAVRPDSPWLHAARQSAARLCTELELFIENCPAKIIAVTGSNGKSTTAAMIASILNAAGRRAFLGGNIGGSLLDDLPRMTADDWVVLEISSFQLWHFASRTPHAPREEAAEGVRRIHVAVVTGCSPNHLDWHGNFADYVAAKQRILAGQTSDDFAVLNTFDAEVASWLPLVRGRPILVSGADIPVCRAGADDARADRNVCPTVSLDDLPPLQTPGEHNRINAACAAAAASAIGCTADDIRRGLESFRGLPQRLEPIALIEGRRFYNDSAATTPESTRCGCSMRQSGSWRAEKAKDSISSRSRRKSSAMRAEPRFSARLAVNYSIAPLRQRANSNARLSKRCRRRSIGAGVARGREMRSCYHRPARAPISSATFNSGANDTRNWSTAWL